MNRRARWFLSNATKRINLSDVRHEGAVGVLFSGSQDGAPEFSGKRPQKFRGIWAPQKIVQKFRLSILQTTNSQQMLQEVLQNKGIW